MTKVSLIFKSYANAIDINVLLQRLPALVIALWLGVISISLFPHLNIIEGGFLFLFFLISTLLIESALNPKKIKNKNIAQAIRTLGYRNYKILILIHIMNTMPVNWKVNRQKSCWRNSMRPGKKLSIN